MLRLLQYAIGLPRSQLHTYRTPCPTARVELLIVARKSVTGCSCQEIIIAHDTEIEIINPCLPYGDPNCSCGLNARKLCQRQAELIAGRLVHSPHAGTIVPCWGAVISGAIFALWPYVREGIRHSRPQMGVEARNHAGADGRPFASSTNCAESSGPDRPSSRRHHENVHSTKPSASQHSRRLWPLRSMRNMIARHLPRVQRTTERPLSPIE